MTDGQPHDPINRDNQASPDLGICDDCGLPITEDDVVIEAHWHLYDSSPQSDANGWVQWCGNCIPPGIPRPK